MKKIAIVLFNLGGPDNSQSIRPFLRNLFSDKAIIDLPLIARLPLALLISTFRAPKAKPLYDLMGGYSPLFENTKAQAEKIEAELNFRDTNTQYKIFIAMRYWHPFTNEAVKAVNEFAPDKTILLPLYPQYSLTTTGSSVKEWEKFSNKDYRLIRDFPILDGLVKSAVKEIKLEYEKLGNPKNVRVLFSAHGLPQKIIDAGDPYEMQVRQTADAISKELGKDFETRVCFQSKVGPLKWLEPATTTEIERAAKDKFGIIIYPIAFVSEHIETLVELDVEYKELAHELGVPFFARANTCSIDEGFIGGLCDLVQNELDMKPRE